jgi:hypothetical protein
LKALQNRCLESELKIDTFTPNKRGADVKTKLLKNQALVKVEFSCYHVLLPNSVMETGVLGTCVVGVHMSDSGELGKLRT